MGKSVNHILKHIDLDVEAGEYLAIMGPSGSGKTTLMNLIGCLDTPTSGKYWLDGVSVREMGRNDSATLRNRKIGFVFQSYNLLPKTTALENVELPLFYNPDVSARERRERATEAAAAPEAPKTPEAAPAEPEAKPAANAAADEKTAAPSETEKPAAPEAKAETPPSADADKASPDTKE